MRASSSTTTMRSGRVLAGVFICNSTYVTAAILPGENPCQGGKPTLCYIYFGLCLRFRDVEHGRLVARPGAASRHTARLTKELRFVSMKRVFLQALMSVG